LHTAEKKEAIDASGSKGDSYVIGGAGVSIESDANHYTVEKCATKNF
jgi:hypothetical protein